MTVKGLIRDDEKVSWKLEVPVSVRSVVVSTKNVKSPKCNPTGSSSYEVCPSEAMLM